MKKIISLLLSAVLLFGTFSTVLSAVECEHENTEWQQITDGCALVCTDCGEMLSEEIPHDFVLSGEYTDEEDCELWGCTGERYREVRCTRCGCSGSEWIEPLGHDFVDHVCTRCGEDEPEEPAVEEPAEEPEIELPELTPPAEDCEHEWLRNGGVSSWTCTQNGYDLYYCPKCGGEKTEVRYGVNHHYVDGVCKDCGLVRPPVSETVSMSITPNKEAYAYGDELIYGFHPIYPDDIQPAELDRWESASCVCRIIDRDGVEAYRNVVGFSRGDRHGTDLYGFEPGIYTLIAESYLLTDDGEPVEIAYGEFSFEYAGYNGAKPYSLSVDSCYRTYNGLEYTATLLSEDGLPVQCEPVKAELLRGSEVIYERWANSDGSGIVKDEMFPSDDVFTEGVYTLRVSCDEHPEIFGEYEYVNIKKPLLITVTTEKDSYDYYNMLKYTVTVTNEEGTTEGIDWIFAERNSYLVFITVEDDYHPLWVWKDFSNREYTFTDEVQLDVHESYAGHVEFTVQIDDYSGSCYFDYTGELVPCEGEHVWGYYYQWTEGHFRECTVCGFRSELEPHTFGDEHGVHEFGDGELPCYEEYRVCTVCKGEICGEAVHPNGNFNTETEIVQEPGCTEYGYIIRATYCLDCRREIDYKDEWIEPLGHDFVDGVCTRCGEAEPDCDHIWIYGSMTVPHDCLDTGHVVLMCDNCGTRKNVTVHGVNHHYENGVCTVCGAEKPEASSDVEFDIELDRDAYDYGDYIDLDFKHNLTDEYWEDHYFLQYAEYIFDEDGNIVFENNGALYRNLSGARLNVLTADTPSGRYTVEVDVYVPDGNGGFTIIQSAEPFDFTEYNGALPYALEVYELERNRWGLDFGATLTSEEGLPVQNKYVDVTITRDGEVLCEYSETTDGKGKLALQYYTGDSLSEGSYKITAVCSDRPEIKAEYEFEIIKKDPVINVTLDKDSYDYYNKVAYTVTLTNEEGTTDGLEWLFEYGDLWFEVELTDENGDVISYNGGDIINGYTGEGEFRLFLDEEYAGKLGVRITIWHDGEYSGVAYFDYSGEQIECEEHVWGDYVDRWDGHCRVCDVCGAESELEPHVEPEEWTTIEFGDGDLKCHYSYKNCPVCGALLERTETVHPGGHFSEHTKESEPGCDYFGDYHRYIECDDCGDLVETLEWRRIPPLGHNIVDGVCTRCGVEADCLATLTLDKTEAGDGELIIATYTLTDVDGNPIPGVQVFFCTDFTGRNFDRMTDENGVAVFGFRPTLPHKDEDGYIYYGNEFGEYLLVAYTDEYRTSNAFATFEFVEKDVTEEKYTVICEVSPDFIGDYSVTKDTVTYTFTVLDENGDPVHGVYVTFETWYGDVHLYSGLLITNDEGISLFKTGFTEDDETPAGTYTIVAKAGDASASDTFVFVHETEEDETPAGDCNGDGVINNKDVVVMFKYVSNSGAEYNKVYDFNGDGSVNNKDVVALFKYVSRT